MFDVGNALLIQLFKTYARPYLDYASIIYSTHHLQLMDAIERVQRNFTKRLYGLRQFSYVERLRALDLESLEVRRIRNDLVTLYKFLHGRHPVYLRHLNVTMYEEQKVMLLSL